MKRTDGSVSEDRLAKDKYSRAASLILFQIDCFYTLETHAYITMDSLNYRFFAAPQNTFLINYVKVSDQVKRAREFAVTRHWLTAPLDPFG